MNHATDMRKRLEDHGINVTPQRLAVAAVMLDRPQHLTAEQVHARVNAEARPVSIATVYNTLKRFSERGLVREVVIEPGRVFYDSTTTKHHHFYDVATGELSDIPAEKLDFASFPDAPAGREVDGVDVVIRVRPSS